MGWIKLMVCVWVCVLVIHPHLLSMGGFHFLKTNILQLARKNSGVVRDLIEVLETLLKIPKSVLDYKDSPMTNYIPVIVQT